ncbi:PAAR domain-containing protein [Achromobacter aegrifaciens]|uniref:PAAR domain-containing protein n=1 Tax=Achromobacter aegrifaciens TaxID=1287736 RepID=UPI00358FA621
MLLGREIALVGHKVLCPKCKGAFPILPDPGRNHSFMGSDTAVEGMRTACGAVLIASQMVARIGETEGPSETMEVAIRTHPTIIASFPVPFLKDQDLHPLKFILRHLLFSR